MLKSESFYKNHYFQVHRLPRRRQWSASYARVRTPRSSVRSRATPSPSSSGTRAPTSSTTPGSASAPSRRPWRSRRRWRRTWACTGARGSTASATPKSGSISSLSVGVFSFVLWKFQSLIFLANMDYCVWMLICSLSYVGIFIKRSLIKGVMYERKCLLSLIHMEHL